MKKLFISLFFMCFVVAFAEEANLKSDGNSVGLSFKLGEFSKDYSLGVGLTSPRFWNKTSAVRLHIDVPFRHTTWRPYVATSVVLIGGDFMQTANIRLYGGGGVLLLFPLLAGEPKLMIGGTGFFGFEFFFSSEKSGLTYFIELGGSGTGPIGGSTNYSYATGFQAHTGLRYYFATK